MAGGKASKVPFMNEKAAMEWEWHIGFVASLSPGYFVMSHTKLTQLQLVMEWWTIAAETIAIVGIILGIEKMVWHAKQHSELL